MMSLRVDIFHALCFCLSSLAVSSVDNTCVGDSSGTCSDASALLQSRVKVSQDLVFAPDGNESFVERDTTVEVDKACFDVGPCNNPLDKSCSKYGPRKWCEEKKTNGECVKNDIKKRCALTCGECSPQALPYAISTTNKACPDPIRITSSDECKSAGEQLGGSWDGDRNFADRCYGCLWTSDDYQVNFNLNKKGRCTSRDQVPICKEKKRDSKNDADDKKKPREKA